MAENVTDQVDEEEVEEEEENQDQQVLDDLTVLTDSTAPLDDPDGGVDLGDDDEALDNQSEGQFYSAIHTGSTLTDSELFQNLPPQGETLISEGDPAPFQEDTGQPLPEIEPEPLNLEVDRTFPPEPEPDFEDPAGPEAVADATPTDPPQPDDPTEPRPPDEDDDEDTEAVAAVAAEAAPTAPAAPVEATDPTVPTEPVVPTEATVPTTPKSSDGFDGSDGSDDSDDFRRLRR